MLKVQRKFLRDPPLVVFFSIPSSPTTPTKPYREALAILQLCPNSDHDRHAIRRAYYQVAKQLHPDKTQRNASAPEFAQLTESFRIAWHHALLQEGIRKPKYRSRTQKQVDRDARELEEIIQQGKALHETQNRQNTERQEKQAEVADTLNPGGPDWGGLYWMMEMAKHEAEAEQNDSMYRYHKRQANSSPSHNLGSADDSSYRILYKLIYLSYLKPILGQSAIFERAQRILRFNRLWIPGRDERGRSLMFDRLIRTLFRSKGPATADALLVTSSTRQFCHRLVRNVDRPNTQQTALLSRVRD
eukprot:g24959.t1